MLVEIPCGPHKEDFTLGEKASCSLFAFAKKTLYYMGPCVPVKNSRHDSTLILVE